MARKCGLFCGENTMISKNLKRKSLLVRMRGLGSMMAISTLN